MNWLELKVPPVVVWLACAGAIFGVARLAPDLTFRLPGRLVIAMALVAAGVAVAIAGIVAFRRKRTTVNPLDPGAATSLVDSGIYRVSRNPMYLGFLLALAGWATYLSNAGAALFLPAFAVYMTWFQITPEERALQAKFGTEFTQYMCRVRRWL